MSVGRYAAAMFAALLIALYAGPGFWAVQAMAGNITPGAGTEGTISGAAGEAESAGRAAGPTAADDLAGSEIRDMQEGGETLPSSTENGAMEQAEAAVQKEPGMTETASSAEASFEESDAALQEGAADAAEEETALQEGAADAAGEETEPQAILPPGIRRSEFDPTVSYSTYTNDVENIVPDDFECAVGDVVTGKATFTFIQVIRKTYIRLYGGGTLLFDTGVLASFSSYWTDCGSTISQKFPKIGQSGTYKLICTEVSGPDEEGYIFYRFQGNMPHGVQHLTTIPDGVYGWWNDNTAHQNLNVDVHLKKRISRPVVIKKRSSAAGPDDMSGGVYLLTGTSGVAEGREYRFETGKDGSSESAYVIPGTYRAREISAPKGYVLNTEEKEITVSDRTEVQEFEFSDRPILEGLRIRKCGAQGQRAGGMPVENGEGDGSLAGAEYTVVNSSGQELADPSDPGKSVAPGGTMLVLVTDERGYAECLPCLPYGQYTIKETKAPEGYRLTGEARTFSVEGNDGDILDMTEDPFEDPAVRAGFHIRKADLELEDGRCGEADLPGALQDRNRFQADHVTAGGAKTQGDAVLSGAEFELYNRSKNSVRTGEQWTEPGGRIAVLTTDENGEITTAEDYLPYGTYELVETRAPEGYNLRGENRKLSFSVRQEDDGSVKDLSEEITVKDEVIRFDIEIVKYSMDEETAGDEGKMVPVAGVIFDIYLVSGKDTPCLSIRTNERGIASTVDAAYPHGRLPYGIYRVSEREGTQPDGLLPVEDFEVDGTKSGSVYDGKVYRGIYKNDLPVAEKLQIRKADAGTGRVIPLEGAQFQILDASGIPVRMKENGEEISTFRTDESGTAVLPQRLKRGTYTVREIHAPAGYVRGEDMTFEVSSRNEWENVITWTFPDIPCSGILEIVKKDAGTGERIGGASFAVYADENIVTPDGTERLEEGELACMVMVGKDGTGKSSPLYPGKYHVEEVKAPEGYVKAALPEQFEIIAKDEDTPSVTVRLEIANPREEETETETETEKPAHPESEKNGPTEKVEQSVKTGDGTPVHVLGLLAVLSASVITAAGFHLAGSEENCGRGKIRVKDR